MRSYLVVIAIVIGLMTFHLLILPDWPISRYIVNIAVILVIALTLQRGLLFGLTAAMLIGLAETGVSAISGPAHVIALVALSTTAWFISMKIMTTRSAASLIFITSVATAIYGATFIITEMILTFIDHQRVTGSYYALTVATLCTVVTHPILISLIWRWRKWDRYSQVSSPVLG